MASPAEFTLGSTSFNPQGWGPRADSKPARFAELPYAHYSKTEYIGTIADFTGSRRRRGAQADGRNAEFQYRVDREDKDFNLVDNVKIRKAKVIGRNKNQSRRVREQRERERRERERGGPNAKQGSGRGNQQPVRKRQTLMRNRRQQRRNRVDRNASVQVQATWELKEEFDLSQLLRCRANEPTVDDLRWCGFLDKYDESWDRVKVRGAKNLRKYNERDFYYVNVTDDPVMESLVVDGEGDVYITDSILAMLVTAPRSVYPWDVVVQKANDMLFFEKREAVDLLTVSETAMDPPNSDDPENVNHPDRLATEATMVNQNFSQQILQPPSAFRRNLEFPHPFADDDEEEDDEAGPSEPASVAYRYRRFNLGEGMRMVVRCELNAVTEKKGQEQMMTAFALNEWDSKMSQGMDWRQKLDTQPIAVMGTEIKNNSTKIARWAVKSVVAGADVMRVGFVSRKSRTNPTQHVIMGGTSLRPRDFASQLRIDVQNLYGVIKMIIGLFKKVGDGKYVIMRDPNKNILRIYQVPMDTWESDEEEDEDDEDSDDYDSEEEDDA